jgi:carbon-monoxide dehydrogenase medium subunit
MIRQPFTFHAPHSVAEVVRLLVELGDEAKVLAGGQSLMPAMNLGVVTPRHVVSLNCLRSTLSYVREEGNEIAIGALTMHHTLAVSPVLQHRCRLLAEAAADIGDVQIRHRGTIGGSISHFDPAADYPPVCLVLGAKFRLAGPTGERLVPAEEFFVGYLTTALNANEIVTEVRVPVLPVRTGSAYVKHRRIEGGFAIVGSAAIVELDNNICQRISVAVSGGGAIPFCIPDVEGRCHGKRMDESLITEIAEAAYNAAEDPTNELHTNAEYKREMVRVFTKRAVRVAVERVGG